MSVRSVLLFLYYKTVRITTIDEVVFGEISTKLEVYKFTVYDAGNVLRIYRLPNTYSFQCILSSWYRTFLITVTKVLLKKI